MKIGLVGYLNFGNFGDELFVDVYKKYLGNNHEYMVMNDLLIHPYITDIDNKIKSLDIILVVGGDLCMLNWISPLYFNEKYLEHKIDIYYNNIGVVTSSGINDNHMSFYKKYFNHPNVKYIGARDKVSHKFISEKFVPSVGVQLCPDIVMSLDFIRHIPNNIKQAGYIIRASTPGFIYEYKNIISTMKYLIEKGHVINIIIAGTGITRDADIGQYNNMLPILIKENIAVNLIDLNNINGMKEYIAECDILISNKFHGCVVGLCSNIPTLSLSGDNKFVTLYNELGLSQYISHIHDDDILSKVSSLIEGDFMIDDEMKKNKCGAINYMDKFASIIIKK